MAAFIAALMQSIHIDFFVQRSRSALIDLLDVLPKTLDVGHEQIFQAQHVAEVLKSILIRRRVQLIY